MSIPFLSDIILKKGNKIEFTTEAGASAGSIDIDTSGNLVLSNTAGDVLLGDGASDVYVGDGTNNVDILFEQSGSIKADDSASGVTLTLGSSNTTLAFGGSTSFADIVSGFSPTALNTIDIGTNAKPFKNIYAAHHVGGSSINYATSRGWVEDAAGGSYITQVGYYGGNFGRNGDESENAVVWGIDPFGNKALLWKAIGQTSDDDDDGGWNKDITIPANNNIGYLSYYYFKIDFTPDSDQDGQFYHGCGTTAGQTINLADDSNNTNPYFNNGLLSTSNNGAAFVANRWYLTVGIIQAYNNETTDTDTITGVYDVETGEKVKSGSEFKMGNNTTAQRHRAYLYYQDSTSSGNMYFWNPGFHAIDGSEPKIQDLVKRQVYLNDNVKAAFGNSNDLNIYHNGSHSFIQDTGTGDLRLLGSTIRLQSTTEENMIVAAPDGSVQLFYNNVEKLKTDNAGVGITGNAYLTSGNHIHFDNGVTNNYYVRKTGTTLEFKTGGSYNFLSGDAAFAGAINLDSSHVNIDGNGAVIFDNTNNNNAWYIRNGGSNSATLQFGLGDSPGSNIKHTFNGSGSVVFGGNIGLGGATSPNRLLHIDNTSSTTTASAYFYTNAQHTGSTTQAHVSIYSDHASSTGQTLFVRGDGTGDLLVLNKGGTNKMVVTDDGDVTATSFTGDGSNLTNLPAGSAPSNMVTTDTSQTISGNKNFTGTGNQFNGHLYFNAYDSQGNHYPHFRDGSANNGANVNIRHYYGSSYKTHVMSSDSSGNMQFDFQGTLKGDALTIDGGVDINGNTDISGTLGTGRITINSNSDNILNLNQTSSDNKWNYINFNNQGTREWFIGQDSDGNFDLYNDNVDAYAITVNLSDNSILLNDNVTVAQALNITSGDVTLSAGNVIVGSQYGIRFNDANTRIYTNTDSPEDLIIEADQDLLLTPDGQVSITGNLAVSGTVDGVDIAALAAANTGTNTGDQDLSAYITQTNADARYVLETGGSSSAMTGDLHIIAGAPKIYLQDNSDDDDQQIIFRNNGGSDEYKIATQDFTSGGGGDGFYIGSTTSDGELALVTANTTALTLDTSQNATFSGNVSTGSITAGSDTNEKDFKVYGNDTGELLQWLGAHSKLRINHDTDDAGLEIFTVSSAQPTSHQIKIGRDSGQYLGIRVDDGRSYFIHRQDEGGGSDNHHQTNQIWTDGGGTHTWNWDIADSSGGSPSNKMQLNSSGALSLAGNLTASNFSGSSSGTNTGDQDLSSYATLASPALTGNPTAPTQTAGNNTTRIATTAFVTTAVSNLVDTAPAALDTLNELAAALGDDASFSTTTATALGNRVRVDTASQGLSSDQKSNARTNIGAQAAGNYLTSVAYTDLTGTVPTWNQNTTGTSASSAKLTDGGSLTTHPGTSNLIYTGQISNGTTGLFAATDNSNSVITLNRHSGEYNSQLGFSSNGNIYYRKKSNTANNTQVWKVLAFTDSDTDAANITSGTLPDARLSNNVFVTRSATVGTTSDWNDFVIQGTYGVASGSGAQFTGSNRPVTSGNIEPDYRYGHLVVTEDSDGQGIQQTYYPHNGTRVFFRTGWNNSSWTNWAIIWTDRSDGSGSGLDADLLDGNHASAFSTATGVADNADVTPSWVPSSDPGYLTSSSTQSKYLRSDEDDTATGVITFDGGALGNTSGNTSDNAIFKGTQSNNAKLTIKDIRTANGTDWTSAGKRLQMRIDSTDMGYLQFNGTGNNYGISMGTGSSSTERFKITSGGAASFTGSLSSASLGVTNNITVGGTVDGVDISSLPTFSTVGTAFAQLGDVSVASYIRVNADETLSYLNASQFLSAIGGQAAGSYLTEHPNISAESSSNNSGRTYIQDITLDSNGHVTGIATATETVTNTNTQLSNSQVIDAIVESTGISNSNKTTIRSNIGAGTSSLALGTTSSTALAGNTTTITTAQANAITANTAKTGISSSQAQKLGYITVTQAVDLDDIETKAALGNTAYGYGDHADAGYLTSLPSHNHDDRYYTETEIDGFGFLTSSSTQSKYLRSDQSDQVNGDLIYVDSVAAKFGTSSDLQIYHDGTNNIVKNIKHGANTYFQSENSSGTLQNCIVWGGSGSSVELRYNNANRLLTTTNGVELNGSVTLNNKLELSYASTSGSQFEQPSSSVVTYRVNSDRFRVWMGGGSNETFTVAESGRVGINDSTPDYTLDVSGNVSNISIYASHDVAAYSDARVKTDIETIPNALDKVNKLRGVTFVRTDEGSTDKRMMGVIAQEVKDILPEVVNERESDGHYSVSYGNMVGVLIEAVKELTAEVEELKKCGKCDNCNCKNK